MNTVKLSWFNVANARNDEASAQYRYAQRESRVIDAVASSGSDVVSILELRLCSDLEKTRLVPPEELGIRMASAVGMQVAALRPQNLDAMAFWRMTMFNADKLIHLQSACHWAIPSVFESSKVADRGVMFIFSQFALKCDRQKRFWVINAHMPIAEEEKMRCVAWLNENAVDICNRAAATIAKGEKQVAATTTAAAPTIFYGGDQNTFFDLRGGEMMSEFAKRWTHLSVDAQPTFKSFPQDPVQTTSTLDHIFVNHGARYQVTDVTATDTAGASDHFFMSTMVKIE